MHPMQKKRAPNVMNNSDTLPHNVPCDGCDTTYIVGNRYRYFYIGFNVLITSNQYFKGALTVQNTIGATHAIENKT